MFHPHIQAALGLTYNPNEPRCIARGQSFEEGEIGCFDFGRLHAATTNAKVGDRGSSLANIVVPSLGSQCRFFVFAICRQPIAEGHEGLVCVSGKARAKVGESVAAGDVLCAEVGSDMLHVASADSDTHKVVAIAMESFTYAGTPGLIDVSFEGVAGVGQHIEGL